MSPVSFSPRPFSILFALLLAACGSTKLPCTAASCSGCCDAAGSCQAGLLSNTCGANGSSCQNCGGAICALGQCALGATGGGTSAGGGTTTATGGGTTATGGGTTATGGGTNATGGGTTATGGGTNATGGGTTATGGGTNATGGGTTATGGGTTATGGGTAAPHGLSYLPNPATLLILKPASSLPSSDGGLVISYSAVNLPHGLSISASSGEVHGTPDTVQPASTATITATNASGSVTCQLNLAVVTPPPPVILVQPVSQSASTGQLVTFDVTASGTDLNYRWRVNGVVKADSHTAQYRIDSVTNAFDGASVEVEVTDYLGRSVTSTPAYLVMNWLRVDAGFEGMGSVWGTSATDVWACGGPVIKRWNGAVWSTLDAGLASSPGNAFECNGLWGSGPNNVWAITVDGSIHHWDGTAWNFVANQAMFGNAGSSFTDIWGLSENDVWASNPFQLYHFDGGSWGAVDAGVPAYTQVYAFGIWSSGPNDVWAVGDINMRHWNGAEWSPVDPGLHSSQQLIAVWGHATNDVWAAGNNNTLLHWNGTGWTASSVPGLGSSIVSLNKISGTAANNVWAVGNVGFDEVILHWNGSVWAVDHQQSSGDGGYASMVDVWASGQEVWAVDQSGRLLHRK